jgi:hypothetical protein
LSNERNIENKNPHKICEGFFILKDKLLVTYSAAALCTVSFLLPKHLYVDGLLLLVAAESPGEAGT